MKKLLLSACVIGLLSCSKKDNALVSSASPTNDGSVSASSLNGSTAKEGDPVIKVNGYYDVFSHWCAAHTAYNCIILPEVIINGTARLMMTNTVKNNSSIVASTFKRPELQDIANHLPKEYRDKLRSGNYYVSQSFENSSCLCYIAGTTYPVTDSNMEFAFQVNKGK